MNEILEEFKNKVIKDIEENPKLLALDQKIAKLEAKLTGIEFKDFIFKVKKRLARIERVKWGFSLDTDDDGKEN